MVQEWCRADEAIAPPTTASVVYRNRVPTHATALKAPTLEDVWPSLSPWSTTNTRQRRSASAASVLVTRRAHPTLCVPLSTAPASSPALAVLGD